MQDLYELLKSDPNIANAFGALASAVVVLFALFVSAVSVDRASYAVGFDPIAIFFARSDISLCRDCIFASVKSKLPFHTSDKIFKMFSWLISVSLNNSRAEDIILASEAYSSRGAPASIKPSISACCRVVSINSGDIFIFCPYFLRHTVIIFPAFLPDVSSTTVTPFDPS